MKSLGMAIPLSRSLCVLVLATASAGCGGSPSAPSTTANAAAVIVLNGLSATVEPVTLGWSYRLDYQVRETGGKRGATLISSRFELRDGAAANGVFTNMPRVAANSTITLISNLGYRYRRRRRRHTSRSRSTSPMTAGYRVQPAPKQISFQKTDYRSARRINPADN